MSKLWKSITAKEMKRLERWEKEAIALAKFQTEVMLSDSRCDAQAALERFVATIAKLNLLDEPNWGEH